MEVLMLDEQEYAIISELFSQGMRATKEYRQKYNLPASGGTIEDRFQPVRDAYRQITGVDETNHLAILHHRISLYGPECHNCGKPLRTERANFCAACGTRRDRQNDLSDLKL
jgi:hypothetical protein